MFAFSVIIQGSLQGNWQACKCAKLVQDILHHREDRQLLKHRIVMSTPFPLTTQIDALKYRF